MQLVATGTRFALLKHMVSSPRHLFVMLAAMAAAMAAAMLWLH